MNRKTLLLLLFPIYSFAQQKDWLSSFPKGYTPQEVGSKIATRFISAKHALHAGKYIGYPETFYWTGALKFAALTKNTELLAKFQSRFEPLYTTEKALLPIMNHVDLNMFGSLPLELYQITPEKRYLTLGLPYADTQWEVPKMHSLKKRNGQLMDIHGKHVCGWMTCT